MLPFTGCRHFEPQPIEPARSLEKLEQRSLADAGLKQFVQSRLKREPVAWDLETLTLAAFYFHPDLDAARARWAVTEAGKVTAGQRPNPTLSVSPGYDSTTHIPSPWIVSASLDVPIETAGKRSKRIAQAEHLSQAARLGIASTAWEVRTRLRRALLELWSAQESEAALAAQHDAQKEIVRLLEGQRDAGAATLSEVTRERIALEQTRVTLLDAQNRRTTASVQLATALGVPSRALDGVKLSFDAFTQPPAELPSAEARHRALLNRADVLAGLAEYAASESALQLEIARQYPDVHLSPGYQYDQGDNKWGLGLSVELPVLNQNQGPIAEAEARRREQAAKFNSLQARVLGEIEIALAGYDTARAKLAAAATVIQQLDKQERLTQGMFEAGEVSRQAVAAARVERTTAALSQLDARLRAQDALGQLENALQLPSELATAPEQSPRAEKAEASSLLRLTQTIALPHVKGGFDLMAIDLAGKRLFLNAEDNNTTEVIDLAAGKLAHTITDVTEPKWVVYRPELHRLYIANGNGNVRVLNSDSFATQRTIEFKEKANNLRFDAKTGELFIGVGKKFGAIGVVDTRTDAITAEIPLANFPKQFEVEGNLIYVNVPAANHVAVVDRKKKAVVATWPVTAAKDNVPMGFDRAQHRLFIGCEPGRLAVLNSTTGKQIAALDIAPEPDGVHYDAKRRRLYISCGEGSIDVVRQTDADHYEFAGRVPTAKGAATSLFVPQLDQLFLAVPQRDGQTAELRVYSVNPK